MQTPLRVGGLSFYFTDGTVEYNRCNRSPAPGASRGTRGKAGRGVGWGVRWRWVWAWEAKRDERGKGAQVELAR